MSISDLEQESAGQDSVSVRSHVSDVTFHDTANIITRINRDSVNGFPFRFIERNRMLDLEVKTALREKLKPGDELPPGKFNDDWIIFFVFIAAFFYATLPVYSRKLFPGATRFFLFRGVGEPESRETSELFHWQSTLFNLVTFFNIAIFIYFAFSHYGIIPAEMSGFAAWAAALGVVIAAVSIRHIACMLTGWFSSSDEIFREYTITIYQAYRYAGFASFLLSVLLAYTGIFLPELLFLSGFIIFAVLYIMRTARLFLIFMKRGVSILYLILYLCALEFLPVVVIVKYTTGLF
ncbi:MAG: DUF4271 domain-containing protein [Bacteroidales bacterium]|jgi:hypothetical protein|nr:DUF4271 domain-containing protein [Bacteroidales bacterium]